MTKALRQLDDTNVERALADAQRPLLLEVGARWCPPCRAIEPHLAAIAVERADVDVATLDSDDNQVTSAKFGVRALPTLLLFVHGRVVAQVVGAQSRGKLDAWLDAHLPPRDLSARSQSDPVT